MFTLFHHPFCPHSRFIRLALGEYGLELRLVEERAWERREGFLALNPAGTTPVLFVEGQPAIPGAAIIAEYVDETLGAEMDDRRLAFDEKHRRGSGRIERQKTLAPLPRPLLLQLQLEAVFTQRQADEARMRTEGVME